MIPFSVVPKPLLKKVSHKLRGIGAVLGFFFPFIKVDLVQAEIKTDEREYLAMCAVSDLVLFAAFWLIFGMPFGLIGGLFGSLGLTVFVFLQQIAYPKVKVNRRLREIEKNLLAALQNMLVQLTAGVALFDILVSISRSDYGEVSKVFAKAVREIEAGRNQIKVLDEIAANNPSLFFRRAVWQIVNGMKAGSDLARVIRSVIKSLGEEQVVQIQSYGSQLNPLAMFYMLVAVIIPSLGITFIIAMSSFTGASEFTMKFILWGLYGFVFFAQIMFLGVIKSRRPNLI